MTVAAPVIEQEMEEWETKGGVSSGIVGNRAHRYGFHLGAEDVPPEDYSRVRDPNGSDGPFVNWAYACAGDFSHQNKESLRAMHRDVLTRLMNGELPMICEFIGKPWVDRPVYYWARWNGVKTLQLYTGAGHDHWSHISWYRSRVNQRAYLWTSEGIALMFASQGSSGQSVKYLQYRLKNLGYDPGPVDGSYGTKTATALRAACRNVNAKYSGNGSSYDADEMIYLDVLWVRKYGAGARGPAGPAGPMGKAGPAGPPGPQGPQGRDGMLQLPDKVTVEALIRPAQ